MSQTEKQCNCPTKYCEHYESDFDRFLKQTETRKILTEILGLETDEHGEIEMLVTYDEDGDAIEGISFSKELDQIEDFMDQEISRAINKERERTVKRIENMVKNAHMVYMVPETEERFIKDLQTLLTHYNY